MKKVKIRRTVQRVETDVIEHELTPEEYAEFKEQRKALNTGELGQWLADTANHSKYWDSYGTDYDTTSIYDEFEDETIQG